jgi:hypothetical protein
MTMMKNSEKQNWKNRYKTTHHKLMTVVLTRPEPAGFNAMIHHSAVDTERVCT